MKKIINTKNCLFLTIFLFVAFTFTPTVYAINTNINIFENKINEGNRNNLVDIEITEYQADGTVDIRIISLSENDFFYLKNKLLETKDVEERFPILQEYGIVSRETSVDDWENAMKQKAIDLGINSEDFKVNSPLKLPFFVTFLNSLNGVFVTGSSVRIGTTPILSLLNLPGVDVVDAAWGMVGVVDTRNIIFSHSLVAFPGFMFLVGFVGISIKIPLTTHIFTGYSAATIAFGLGIHDRQFLWWLPN